MLATYFLSTAPNYAYGLSQLSLRNPDQDSIWQMQGWHSEKIFCVPRTTRLVESKWWKVKAKVAHCVWLFGTPLDYTVHGILQARILEWGAVPFFKDLSNPGIKPRSPALQVDSLPAEPQVKPK